MIPRPLTNRNTVLLICDIQEKFRHAIYGFDSVVHTTLKVLKCAKLLEIPAIVSEQNPKALGSTVDTLVSEIQALPSHSTFSKTKFSMIIPEVEEELKKAKYENAIILGIESHVCVLQTTLDLLRSNISVYVLADGISSCNRQEVPIAMDRMRQAGAYITTSESILFELMNDAKTSVFKPLSAIAFNKDEKATTRETLETLLDGGAVPKSSL
ncbi:Isochorismatase hydrolase [Kockovaella imperatae]|uniref:Isochorismatase hydrolase n=1 Tax=Kockovaella imperatae TaxID=4999 RepID=A0A1Y1UIY9_9TREE|nr:Isochorismatase hydrolase [Kockovaella imperatae]ORX37939.1 Isochorismatase hydrolase [Kockovaella imperatae]